MAMVAVTEREVEDAASFLDGRVRRTPLVSFGELSRRVGARVVLKAENLQLTGSFKTRGAINTIARMSSGDLSGGVAAASAGNHAQAVAFAAREAGVRATLVMPESAPLAKLTAVRQYGGEVELAPGTVDDCMDRAGEIAASRGGVVVHAFDAPSVVAGQGTVGVEIAEELPGVRLAIVPFGGGGLVAGTAMALKARVPGVRVVAVEVSSRSASTICDGIAVKHPGQITAPLVERYVDELVTVSDDEVAEAMVLLLERTKLVVEGAGAVGVAALMHGRVDAPGETCVVLSGGNVDASLLSEAIRLGETSAGRRMVLATVVPDRPGALARLLRVVADQGANVVDVEHLRDGIDLHVRETAIQLVLETRGPDHGGEIAEAVRREGFSVRLAG